ncbi:MAG: hypothetical protein M1819_007066 [Sarea resinae]|nr:MAG: hypothetical protein M1819_007066 [Sarea resinae]
MAPNPFNPALLVIDVQEDFCPPHGSLAVPSGRAVAPTINTLLTLPFTTKIATRDWHPKDHISFASNHPAPDNIPAKSTTTIVNPRNSRETSTTLLWPDHCIQHTPGADLIPELDAKRLDRVIDKGRQPGFETYSAFGAPFRDPVVAECESGLKEALRGKGVSHVFVVGLAADFCVACTAADAAEAGFETLIVEEGVRAVDGQGWGEKRRELKLKGVRVVGLEGQEVGWVRELTGDGE